MGYDETCNAKGGDSCVVAEDEVNLMQLHAQVHAGKHSKRAKPDMHKVLASFEAEEGPMALQELVQAVMVLPVLKTKEAMLEAVRAQPQLQHLAKRYPHFLHTIGIFEDPSSIQQIKAAVFKKHQSPVKMQGRQPRKVRKGKGDVQLLGTHLEKENTTEIDLFFWLAGWGCGTNFSYAANPGQTDEEMGEHPVFGPDCAGYPHIPALAIDSEAQGGYYVKQNSSADDDGNWKTTYTMTFANGEKTEELFDLDVPKWMSGYSFNMASHTFDYIATSGDWPNYTFTLMTADILSKTVTSALSITDCMYPSSLTRVPGSDDLLWSCSKNWEVENDTSKLMKYSGGNTEILAEDKDYFGYVTASGSEIVYSKWSCDDTCGNDVYTCSIEDCTFVKAGTLPEGVSSWGSILTESGALISTVYEWTGSESKYSVNAIEIDTGKSDVLFTPSTWPQCLQRVDIKVPVEPDVPVPADPAMGPPGAPGPAGPPGPPGPSL